MCGSYAIWYTPLLSVKRDFTRKGMDGRVKGREREHSACVACVVEMHRRILPELVGERLKWGNSLGQTNQGQTERERERMESSLSLILRFNLRLLDFEFQ